MRKLLSILAALSFLQAATAQEDTVQKKVEYPAGYQAQTDVVYASGMDWSMKHDIYFNPAAAKPTPVLFNIHGGGWNHGTKESQSGFSAYFKMGYAVVNVEYRLTPQATAPAAVEDVRSSLLYIVQHAKSLNIDPNRIVLMGSSAGAHLALLAGLLQHDTRFDSSNKNVTRFTIAAIIDKYGITDVWDWAYGKHITSRSATNWLGPKAKDRVFASSVSPVAYVAKGSPPVFIAHGDADPTVPYEESVELNRLLDSAGVKHEFMTIPGGQHGKFSKEQNAEMNRRILAFLQSIPALKN